MSTKKALLIGINYRGTDSALNGCINDVNNMNNYLLKHGYSASDITILTDDTPIKPTLANMSTAITSLIKSGASQLFLHYSGHGSWDIDTSGDEEDGRDESLVPLDYQQAGMLTDDHIRELLMLQPDTSNLIAVLDCCHSGTGMDLAYNLIQKTRNSRVKRRNRWISTPEIIQEMKKDPRIPTTPGCVIMLSGCLDKQYSADAYEEGKFQGAMTFCLLKALNANPNCTWSQLITKIRQLLKANKYAQISNLSSGQPLDLSSKVVF